MQEWLNWHAWKACVPLKGTEGSNPSLSAFFIKMIKFFPDNLAEEKDSKKRLNKLIGLVKERIF